MVIRVGDRDWRLGGTGYSNPMDASEDAIDALHTPATRAAAKGGA